MKDVKILKGRTMLLAVMAAAVGLFLSYAASSVDQADSEAIRSLSAEMEKVHTEIAALKTFRSNAVDLSQPTIGEMAMFAGNFAPRGWALCDGQLLPIANYTALFSILGTTYGGDGRTTFALPDLRGRVPVHAGYGPGLTDRRLGEKFGWGSTQITGNQTTSVAPPSGTTSLPAVSGIPNPLDTYQPSVGINYIIALEGTFPSRS